MSLRLLESASSSLPSTHAASARKLYSSILYKLHRPQYLISRQLHFDRTPWVAKESPYSVLGVSPNATARELKRQYLKLSKELHPDRTLLLSDAEREKARARYLLVQQAHHLLKDPLQRRDVDRALRDNVTYSSSSHKPPESQESAPASKIEIIYPWFAGLGLFIIMSYIWISNNNETRRREEQIAWLYFLQQREKEGLLDVVGNKPYKR
eukprot:jgi/Hompol1/2690/HPOL_006145-RA